MIINVFLCAFGAIVCAGMDNLIEEVDSLVRECKEQGNVQRFERASCNC